MRKILLYITTSLDGYIAGPSGEIDWLIEEGDFGYDDFYAGVDTVLMGNKTYELMKSFGVEAYENVKNYVFTKNADGKASDKVEYVSGDIAGFTRDLKDQNGKDIWLVGGAEINSIMLENDLIDEIFIFFHPIVLGSGIRLFNNPYQVTKFKSVESKAHPEGLLEWHLVRAR